jgi:hypothetical protein
MALDARQERAHLREKRRGTDSSRLAALRVLRAAHADLKARLRRPRINLGHRYRDLLLFTRLIDLELAHLAGRTISSGDEAESSSGADESERAADSAWSDPWGLTTRLQLHNELQRYSAKRQRLRRWLGDAERARAEEAARARYEAIAVSIPWRLSIPSRLAEETSHGAAAEEADVPHATAEEHAEAAPTLAEQRPETPSAPAPEDLPASPIAALAAARGERESAAPPAPAAVAIAATPGQTPARKVRSTDTRALALLLAGGAAVVALVVMLDGSEPRSPAPDGRPGPTSGSGSTSQAAVAASSRRDHGEPTEPGPRRDQPARDSGRPAQRDSGGHGRASHPEDSAEAPPAPAPAPASASVPTSAPSPAPVPTTPAPEPAPPSAPAPEPTEPAAESPPEFGFEN